MSVIVRRFLGGIDVGAPDGGKILYRDGLLGARNWNQQGFDLRDLIEITGRLDNDLLTLNVEPPAG